MAELEDEDNFPNDFDGLDFDNIPGLQAPTISRCTPEVTIPSALPRNIAPSTRSNSAEDMDSSFFAAVDALEARALSEMARGSEPLSCAESDGHPTDAKSVSSLELVDEPLNSDNILKTNSGSSQGDCNHFHGTHASWIEGTSNLYHVHEYSMQSPELFSTKRKGKRKAEPHEGMDIRTVLDGYETDLTCPICCDLLVGAHVTNPCGHTCCGECSYGWFARNTYEPTCAVCRSSLWDRKPLLPNFSVDNLVQQHLQALAKSGHPEWQEKGYKTIEWNKRLESWKEQAAVRAAKEKAKETARLRRRRTRTRYYEVGEYSYAAPWGTDESMNDDEDALVARVMPRRGSRLDTE